MLAFVLVEEALDSMDDAGGVNIVPFFADVLTEPYKKLPIFTFEIIYLVDSS